MPVVACLGAPRWKREAVSRLLEPERGLAHVRHASHAIKLAAKLNGAIAVWPSRAPAALWDLAEAHGASIVQIEDGFIRSSGLGAECRPPASIVADRSGIHFDPTRPSDLEQLLTKTRFGGELVGRAERLIDQITALGVTKYNLPGGRPPATPRGRRTVLVVGQVEDDLSVRLGGADVRGNLDLLRRARALEPDALIIYRPHPDVDGGYRRGRLPDHVALRFADQVARGHDLPALIDSVDALHVLSSLTGFEALIRGCEVIVHGQPFYAGWGLTRDLAPPPRRGRALHVTELAAAALILYPRYLDPVTGRRCSPETLVSRLAGRLPDDAVLPRLRRLEAGARRIAGLSCPARAVANG